MAKVSLGSLPGPDLAAPGRPKPSRSNDLLASRAMSDEPVTGATVLVVDDDPVIQRLLRVNFEMEGYGVLIAGSGADGVAQARSAHPDIVILDVMMPGMDGLEVATALKADPATAAIPVLLLSAKAQEVDIRAGDSTGAEAYVTKPFDPLELLELVARLIEASRPPPEARTNPTNAPQRRRPPAPRRGPMRPGGPGMPSGERP